MAGLFLGLALLGALAAAAVRQAALSWNGLPSLTMSSAVEGAPEPLAAELDAWLAARPGADAKAVQGAFPCLASARWRRQWLQRRRVLSVSLRAPVAAAAGGYLSDDGVLFSAPAGLFEVPAVYVDPTGASAAERKAVAAFIEAAPAVGLPAPVARMRFLSSEDGWEARLADGTEVLWGTLDWTREKADRLKQVLAQSQEAGQAGWTADLRYFEDGRILMRPAAAGRR